MVQCWCKSCQELARLSPRRKRMTTRAYAKQTFGADYDFMLLRSAGRCECCGKTFPNRKGEPHIDHCHSSGVVRGLLCIGCNAGIGYFGESPERLRSAIDYLHRHAPPGSFLMRSETDTNPDKNGDTAKCLLPRRAISSTTAGKSPAAQLSLVA